MPHGLERDKNIKRERRGGADELADKAKPLWSVCGTQWGCGGLQHKFSSYLYVAGKTGNLSHEK